MNKKLLGHRIPLNLRRETLRPLNDAGLASVAGGFPWSETCVSTPTNCYVSACNTCRLTDAISKTIKGGC